MPVGIAEIDAFATTRPFGAPFNGNAMRGEPRFPVRKLRAADGKRDMQRAVAVVGRDGTARHTHGLECETAPEEQEHAPSADVIGAESRVAGERLEPEHIAIKARRALEVVHIERGLKHAIELGHGYHMFSVARASSDIRV